MNFRWVQVGRFFFLGGGGFEDMGGTMSSEFVVLEVIGMKDITGASQESC
jgi:hypothetical protein